MGAHGINGDDGPGQMERIEQIGQGGQFAAFFGAGKLANGQAGLFDPCPEEKNLGGRALLTLIGAAQPFSINDDVLLVEGAGPLGNDF